MPPQTKSTLTYLLTAVVGIVGGTLATAFAIGSERGVIIEKIGQLEHADVQQLHRLDAMEQTVIVIRESLVRIETGVENLQKAQDAK